ncbi:MAG: hypothetical protein OYI31_08175 [Chloroflexota bacterium]|nr:hypothetical protein [Chloroflexota bacterium]MDE2940892.1 hypothetical protein [Chloroflexota bacterium]MDE3268407.1 hypothetical protein [Chloroflexota bacterium]
MTYWQVAAGEGARDYSSLFLQYGVIVMGSGHLGSYREHPERFRGHKDWRKKIVTLADRMKQGDVVILKRGHRAKGRIIAVGRVASDYEWLEPFGDVDGWDLRHGRRVEWFRADSNKPAEGLARGTISRVQKHDLRKKADDLVGRECARADAIGIPPAAGILSDDDLMDRLSVEGIIGPDTSTLKATIQSVRKLAAWYIPHMSRISEHEVRTFLIIPLLLALGWNEKQIRIEWSIGGARSDTALFQGEFVKDAKPYLIVESKRFGMGLDGAGRQAVKYAGECNRIVTSTGDRYWLFEKHPSEKWDRGAMKQTHLRAYMNLFRLKDRHPYLPNVGGAPDLLKSLMPG